MESLISSHMIQGNIVKYVPHAILSIQAVGTLVIYVVSPKALVLQPKVVVNYRVNAVFLGCFKIHEVNSP